jgi:hypothetical protein
MQLAYVESGEERRRTRVAWRFSPDNLALGKGADHHLRKGLQETLIMN